MSIEKTFEGLEKRYWIFTYTCHYPRGGMNDFLKGVDNLDNINEILEEYSYYDEYDFQYHILDVKENKLVKL